MNIIVYQNRIDARSFDADVKLQRAYNNITRRQKERHMRVAPVVLRTALGGILPRMMDDDADAVFDVCAGSPREHSTEDVPARKPLAPALKCSPSCTRPSAKMKQRPVHKS